VALWALGFVRASVRARNGGCGSGSSLTYMIMGMDFMTSIGITVDCEQRCIRWGGTEISLKTRATLNNDEILHMLYNNANEPDILQEAEKRQNRILYADYRKVEVDPFVQELKHLTMDEKTNIE
jgi:hypothetical protein